MAGAPPHITDEGEGVPVADLLRELQRAKCIFQLRSIGTVMNWPQDFPAIHPRKDAASSGPDGHKLARPVLSPFHASEVTDD